MVKDEQQIEHFKPKMMTTPSNDLTFDFTNYLLYCQGGIQSSLSEVERKNSAESRMEIWEALEYEVENEIVGKTQAEQNEALKIYDYLQR